MWAFFHGWRRKAGVVSLGLACVLMAVWVRSCLAKDSVSVTLAGRRLCVTSVGGRLYWCSWTRTGRKDELFKWTVQSPWSEGSRLASPYRFTIEDEISLTEIWLPAALNYQDAIGGSFSFSTAVFPLTLICACLFLWKPRKLKSYDQPAISNLIQN
jgi:cbb3-type cytochrome oxidase subunit 3